MGGCPQDVPKDRGCFGPSPFAAAALGHHSHHALNGAQHGAVDQHWPRHPSSCTVGAQCGGLLVGTAPPSTAHPSFPQSYIWPQSCPCPPHLPLNPPSPNLSNVPNSMSSRSLFLFLGP